MDEPERTACDNCLAKCGNYGQGPCPTRIVSGREAEAICNRCAKGADCSDWSEPVAVAFCTGIRR